MSDLGPFVAATIRDRVVVDLQTEKEQLQREVERLRTKIEENQSHLELTGTGGSPVYASFDFSDFHLQNNNIGNIQLSLTTKPLFASKLLDVELHLLGTKVITMREIAESDEECLVDPRNIGNDGYMEMPFLLAAGGVNILFMCLDFASDEQNDIVEDVLNEPNEENLTAYNSCDWTASGGIYNKPVVYLEEIQLSQQTFQNIKQSLSGTS